MNKMKYQNIINLIDYTTIQPSEFEKNVLK